MYLVQKTLDSFNDFVRVTPSQIINVIKLGYILLCVGKFLTNFKI